MQTIVQIICTKGTSLRDSIIKDSKLENYKFKIETKITKKRSPGWTSLSSIDSEHQGSIKIQWDPTTNFLLCRIVNKGSGKPAQITGALISYLLGRYSKRIESISILTAR